MTVKSERLAKLDEQSSTSVSARVPLSLHPAQIENHGPILVDVEGFSGPTLDAYSAGRHALKALYDSAKAIDQAHQSMLKPMPLIGAAYAKGSAPIMKMQIPKERAAELSSAMASNASRAAAVAQRNLDAIDATAAKLDRFIAQKTSHPRPNDASTVAEASEIRTYIKGLKPEQRFGFLHKAAEDKDLPVVCAALNASCFASGLKREEHALLRQFANDAFAPTETKQRAALDAIKKSVNIAMESYAGEYKKRLPNIVEDPSAVSLAALKGEAA